MTAPLPPDPFDDNPLVELDQRTLELMQSGAVDYFDLFPNMYYEDIVNYAHRYVPDVVEHTPSLSAADEADLAGMLIHGIMLGALAQHGGPTVLDQP